MKKNVLLTTTTSIPNYDVIESRGLVFANVVLGNNFFSDFAASITDTFGGTSDSYQGKLEIIYNEVISKLTNKAFDLGCNAIIGFRIDFDQISGKGMSMFMVNAVGTACRAKPSPIEKRDNNDPFFDKKDMEIAIKRHRILENVKSRKEPVLSEDAINYLLDYPTNEIVEDLLDYYYVVKIEGGNGHIAGGMYVADNTPTRVSTNVQFINQYIGLVLDECVVEKVYSRYADNEVYYSIIEQNNIFDSKQVLQIAEQDPIKALKLLGIGKESYSKEDIGYFKQIVSKYENLPNRGSIEMSKGGMFSKSQKQYICENGHTNEEGFEFCKKCGKNIQGLTEDDLQNLDNLKIMITVLENHFG